MTLGDCRSQYYPLNYLALIGHIDVLSRIFTRILVPEAVVAELRHPQAPSVVSSWATKPLPDWLEIRKPRAVENALAYLGQGEREAIALALEVDADALLIDERAGRREAVRHNLRVVGTLAVLEEAGNSGAAELRNGVSAPPRHEFSGFTVASRDAEPATEMI